jgi:chromosome segregation ATPase
MTPTKFFIARVAQAFGINRKNKRMSDAASEMHLLRDAETVLGAAVWEHVERIEELSVEYWNLRRLVKERDEVRAKVASCNEKLELAHNDRAELLNSQAEPHHELMAQRQAIMAKLETVARDRDAVVARAREVRRAYEGMKMKLEVIGKESSEDHPELATVREKLEDLKLKFNELKLLRAKVAWATHGPRLAASTTYWEGVQSEYDADLLGDCAQEVRRLSVVVQAFPERMVAELQAHALAKVKCILADGLRRLTDLGP